MEFFIAFLPNHMYSLFSWAVYCQKSKLSTQVLCKFQKSLVEGTKRCYFNVGLNFVYRPDYTSLSFEKMEHFAKPKRRKYLLLPMGLAALCVEEMNLFSFVLMEYN